MLLSSKNIDRLNSVKRLAAYELGLDYAIHELSHDIEYIVSAL